MTVDVFHAVFDASDPLPEAAMKLETIARARAAGIRKFRSEVEFDRFELEAHSVIIGTVEVELQTVQETREIPKAILPGSLMRRNRRPRYAPMGSL